MESDWCFMSAAYIQCCVEGVPAGKVEKLRLLGGFSAFCFWFCCYAVWERNSISGKLYGSACRRAEYQSLWADLQKGIQKRILSLLSKKMFDTIEKGSNSL